MKAFEQLICKLKVSYRDFQPLHRSLAGGDGQRFAVHELMDAYHAKIAEMTDDLIELGLGAGIPEPGIAEAVKACKPMEIKQRNPRETLSDARVLLDDIADLMQGIAAQLEDDQRYIQFDEYLYYLRKEADYKLAFA